MAEEILGEIEEGQAERPRLRADAATAVLLLALLVGAVLRIAPAAASGFPINDGGMFSVMVDELRGSGYTLPTFTSYNTQEIGGRPVSIPYAYPPAPFYLAAALSDLFRLPSTSALTWLPALFSIASLAAFYFASRGVVTTRMQAAVATTIFALMPRAFSWFLMGGGLTRAAGLLFSLLTIGFFIRLFRERTIPNLLLAILFGALTALSHLEAVAITLGAVALIWVFRFRSRRALASALLAAGGILILTAPWWATVLSRHGLAPFLSAARTGSPALADVLAGALQFTLTEEPLFPVIAALALLGVFAALSHKDYLLPAWLALAFVLDPRSPGWAALIPIAMLGALALTDVIIPGLASLVRAGPSDRAQGRPAPFSVPLVRIFVYALALYLVVDAALAAGQLSRLTLPAADREAMAWVAANTAPRSQFVALTGEVSLMKDPVAEWFPALTNRPNLTTIQGSEWSRGPEFWGLAAGFQHMQTCILQDVDCVREQADELGLGFDYLYVEKAVPGYPCPAAAGPCVHSRALIDSLAETGQAVFENEGVIIFAMPPSG
jgi:hypothetical protein